MGELILSETLNNAAMQSDILLELCRRAARPDAPEGASDLFFRVAALCEPVVVSIYRARMCKILTMGVRDFMERLEEARNHPPGKVEVFWGVRVSE